MSNRSIVNTLEYDRQLCTGCGMYSIVCPHGVFVMSDHVARLVRPCGPASPTASMHRMWCL